MLDLARSRGNRRPGQLVLPSRSCGGTEQSVIMDVGRWLRSLGLAQYEEAFRDNAIDDSVLPSLTVTT